ncbi:hypothetical protein [Azospirillum picis]
MTLKAAVGATLPPARVAGSPTAASGKDGTATTGGGPAVIVSLSLEAQRTLAVSGAAATQVSSRLQATEAAAPKAGSGAGTAFLRYFPTRDGTPASALADAVSNPARETSSAGKSLDEVGADARSRMDTVYAAMAASGQPFDFNSFEGRDWYSLMGSLDRRSLYAVSSNTGGLFSKQEQDIAQSIMSQQQGLAMGLYNGPISQEGSFVDPFQGDTAARMKAGVSFLDKVSNDEKASLPWAVDRASAQISYQWTMDGAASEDLSSDNPLVKLIVSAMDTMRTGRSRGLSNGPINTADTLKAQPWFKGFESQLDGVMQQSKELYRAKAASDQEGRARPG